MFYKIWAIGFGPLVGSVSLGISFLIFENKINTCKMS